MALPDDAAVFAASKGRAQPRIKCGAGCGGKSGLEAVQ